MPQLINNVEKQNKNLDELLLPYHVILIRFNFDSNIFPRKRWLWLSLTGEYNVQEGIQ